MPFFVNKYEFIEYHRNQINNIVGSSLTAQDMEGLATLGLKNPSDDDLSPYSIFRSSRDVDMHRTVVRLQKLAVAAKHGGARSTRTEVLR